MKRMLFSAYGLVCYLLGLISLIAFILFANNGFVDVALATSTPSLGIFAIDIAGGQTALPPLLNNLTLIALFAVQHTVMARPGFKAVFARIIPRPIERSTYILATALVLFILILFWRPMTNTVWQVADPVTRLVVEALFWTGWIISFMATQMIDGNHLMGLKQAFNPGMPESQSKTFITPMFYKLVRHPIQTGIVIAMLATPDMTYGRAVLATGIIIYIFIGLHFEERDLVAEFGDTYKNYKKRVPGLFPRSLRHRNKE